MLHILSYSQIYIESKWCMIVHNQNEVLKLDQSAFLFLEVAICQSVD